MDSIVLLPEPRPGERILVDATDVLASEAPRIAAAPVLGLDVEAGKVRGADISTAALIQIAAPGRTWLIDPLRLSGRMGPLGAALSACTGPVVLFDAPGDVRWLEGVGLRLGLAIDLLHVTRCAYGEEDKSLRGALRRHFRIAMDKSGQQANWLARPLPGPLLHYAARDAELTLALAQRYLDLFPDLMALHTVPGAREATPGDVPQWLRRVLDGDRTPAYDLAAQDGLPIEYEESIGPLLAGANRALDLVRAPWQRARLYRAFATLDLDELAPRIAEGLASACAVERAAASRALGDLDARDYADALGVARRDPIADVARAASRALDALSDV